MSILGPILPLPEGTAQKPGARSQASGEKPGQKFEPQDLPDSRQDVGSRTSNTSALRLLPNDTRIRLANASIVARKDPTVCRTPCTSLRVRPTPGTIHNCQIHCQRKVKHRRPLRRLTAIYQATLHLRYANVGENDTVTQSPRWTTPYPQMPPSSSPLIPNGWRLP